MLRVNWTACAISSLRPMASTTIRAPRPPVRSNTAATGSSCVTSTSRSRPQARDRCSRDPERSSPITSPPASWKRLGGEVADQPQPDHRYRVAGAGRPALPEGGDCHPRHPGEDGALAVRLRRNPEREVRGVPLPVRGVRREGEDPVPHRQLPGLWSQSQDAAQVRIARGRPGIVRGRRTGWDAPAPDPAERGPLRARADHRALGRQQGLRPLECFVQLELFDSARFGSGKKMRLARIIPAAQSANAWSPEQEEKAWAGLSPAAGRPITRMATAATGPAGAA